MTICGALAPPDSVRLSLKSDRWPDPFLATTHGLSSESGSRPDYCLSRKGEASASVGHTPFMPAPLIEFPADDPDRARQFWHGVLGVTLAPRPTAAGPGWQTNTDNLRLGVHERGPGPGDTASLPYFTVADLATTLDRVRELAARSSSPASDGPSAETPRAAHSRSPPRR